MNKTARSIVQKRIFNTSTPISTFSRSSRRISVKQQPTIEDIYNQVKVKMSQMEQAFKQQNMERQRQMLKTYVKILDKIGAEVITAKEKYLNLNKQNLKTDKRLEIVTQLNNDRQECNVLTKNIKSVREQIKRYEDQNSYLQKQVEALEQISERKRQLSKSQHQKYRNSRQKARSLQKGWAQQLKENQKMIRKGKGTLQYSGEKFDIKNRTKSFMLNSQSQQPEGYGYQTKRIKKGQDRPQTQQNYIGNRRKKVYLNNKGIQENIQFHQ